MVRAAAACLLGALAIARGEAQKPSVAVGDTVRVSAATLGVVNRIGTFGGVVNDTLLVNVGDSTWRPPRAQVQLVQVNRPVHRRSAAISHGLLGAALGATGAFVIYSLVDGAFDDFCANAFGNCTTDTRADSRIRLRFVVEGALLGATAGALRAWRSPGRHWVTAALP